MDSSTLTVKAQQIPNSTLGSFSTLAESEETRWIFRYTFNCTSELTGVILGVDIRSVTANRTQFPSVEIWSESRSILAFTYTKLASVPIILTPANFTTSGLYSFTFPTPINVVDGYLLGLYQPPNDSSVVRFYKLPGTTIVGKIKSSFINDNIVTYYTFLSQSNSDLTVSGFDVLVHPITGKP